MQWSGSQLEACNLSRVQGHGLGMELFANKRRQQLSASLPRAQLQSAPKLVRLPAYTLVTNPNAVDVRELSALLAATNQNCEMFPLLSAEGTLVRHADAVKLRRALMHSTVVIAMYVRGKIRGDYMQRDTLAGATGPGNSNWGGPWLPSIPSKKYLVGFGRATSDRTLTASIYDLAVAPSMQRMGLGKRIVSKIVRDLLQLGVSDISVSTTDDLRPFFQCCGFGNDVAGSTAMTYTRNATSSTAAHQSTDVGRKTLYIPSAVTPRTL